MDFYYTLFDEKMLTITTIIFYLAAAVIQGLNLAGKLPKARMLVLMLGGSAVLFHAMLLHWWIDIGLGQNLTFFNIAKVDMQAAGGIDDEYISKLLFSGLDGGFGDIDRLVFFRAWEIFSVNLCGERFELFDRGRAVNVDAGDHDRFFFNGL